jgi:phospholipase C
MADSTIRGLHFRYPGTIFALALTACTTQTPPAPQDDSPVKPARADAARKDSRSAPGSEPIVDTSGADSLPPADAIIGADTLDASRPGESHIQHVFIVIEENRDWDQIKDLPYFQELAQIGAHTEQYYNPRGIHPSAPNYVWMEAGANHGVTTDDDPPDSLIVGQPHLTKLLDAAGISWMSYQEDINPAICNITSKGNYAARHDPFLFFDDVVGDPASKKNAYCIAHHKPFSQFLPDLKAGTVARYNFITPNIQNDMHEDDLERGDAWLKANIDPIVNPLHPSHNPAIYADSVVFVTFDEGDDPSDGPMAMIAVSPFAKRGFNETPGTPIAYHYTHSSLLRTLQEIFRVDQTLLGDAANARSLASLFTVYP